ncbi:gluconokinase [Undibacterium sp. CCC2.1]|nr:MULTISPECIES: gluconokinase [unclassified Undibacterium]MEB0140206.1 gluconokinase [Undibacterium sp. CCC2.1]MEB0173255.1 gluconokinase [Undibacterium sp. CCC1.1]MEB0177056.1 gluconokinase [Undibacterium sp. CCC3.4]MEB0216363.1 gluconokinase [Undibacterium sp. 5I2]WPX45626.1 gluconokinase [Undibacterium sp. CCC3.4]
MGVCACGKSEIGARLAHQLGWRFSEGDSFHPPANVARMAAGIPLSDHDRSGWLLSLQAEIRAAEQSGEGLVLSCSALKRRYRDVLRQGDAQLRFIHLDGSAALLAARLQARPGHFMPLSLLDSQLQALEPLGADEAGLTVSIAATPDSITRRILAAINGTCKS